jgi:hypothetical protein
MTVRLRHSGFSNWAALEHIYTYKREMHILLTNYLPGLIGLRIRIGFEMAFNLMCAGVNSIYII